MISETPLMHTRVCAQKRVKLTLRTHTLHRSAQTMYESELVLPSVNAADLRKPTTGEMARASLVFGKVWVQVQLCSGGLIHLKVDTTG